MAATVDGRVPPGPRGNLLLGSIPGVLIGARLAPFIPGKPLKAILAVMLIFVGMRLLLV